MYLDLSCNINFSINNTFIQISLLLLVLSMVIEKIYNFCIIEIWIGNRVGIIDFNTISSIVGINSSQRFGSILLFLALTPSTILGSAISLLDFSRFSYCLHNLFSSLGLIDSPHVYRFNNWFYINDTNDFMTILTISFRCKRFHPDVNAFINYMTPTGSIHDSRDN